MKTIAQQLGIKDFPFEIIDKNGNKIYHEDPTGFWWKGEFDSNGNLIYYEDSKGYWAKKEYDSRGNLIYYETSDGYVEDNRPKPVEGKIVEIDGKKYKLTQIK
jgi:hypothetical protein